ncbi:MAG: glycosyltransferase family 39 protein [Sphingomonadales bacterium]|nr:glycosyltransferase family 39 protein [Sphingomonadales bacterium]
MPTAAGPERGWLRPVVLLVAAVCALRLAALAFNRTDVFVDEAQYWLWGQRLDLGYYSKPPLIGWLLRAVSEIAGDAPFWLRAPGVLLHGATALVLGALAARLAGRAAALWAAGLYLSAPFVTMGGLFISTDTVMAPFYAGAILMFWRAAETRGTGAALATGALAGLAFLAKYAAIYLILSAGLVAALVPVLRPGWRAAALMLSAFALVISPNVAWNLSHQLATVSHTADNIGWVREGAGLGLGSLAEFLGAQFLVFGPVAMAALIWGFVRPRGDRLALILFAAPPLIAVSAQALLGKAYANWAVATYFAGTVLAVLVLPRAGRIAAVAVNAAISLAMIALTVTLPWPEIKGEPLLQRHTGRADLSQQILGLALAEGVPVLAENRDILADLFYTGRDRGVTIYAPRPSGRAANYYEESFPLPADFTGKLLVIRAAPPECEGAPVPPAAIFTKRGTWAKKGAGLTPYVLDAECLDAAD